MSEQTVKIIESGIEDKAIVVPNANGARYYHMPKEDLQALREFFVAERDAELGRWRDPEAPDYVVYPCPDDEYVRVVNERTGVAQKQWRDTHFCDDTHAVAKRYFAAHPEPKPWDAAKPGELWLFTSHTGYQAPYRVTEAGNFNHAITGGRICLDRMIDAHLMWEKKEVRDV